MLNGDIPIPGSYSYRETPESDAVTVQALSLISAPPGAEAPDVVVVRFPVPAVTAASLSRLGITGVGGPVQAISVAEFRARASLT